VSINNVAVTSQSAKRWKRTAHTDHGERWLSNTCSY
jgi:hypothetical protein